MSEYRRRENDYRLDSIDDQMKELKTDHKKMRDDVTYIKGRIDNGFSTSIKSTENKVDYIDKANTREHSNLNKKFDKLLWALVSIPTTYILSEIVRYFL